MKPDEVIDAITSKGVEYLRLSEFKVPGHIITFGGGYSVVLVVKHERLGRVALKVLFSRKVTAERFVDEVITQFKASKVRNVLSIKGFICEEVNSVQVYGIVTDYMMYGSLSDFIHKHKTPSRIYHWCLAYRILYEISLTMNQLHLYSAENRLLHFDLKPHNILLDLDLHPKICDFGSSRISPISGSNSLRSDPKKVHTRSYASLEFLQTGKRGSKYDVHGFAVSMWEMLSQKHPHGALGKLPSIDQIITDEETPQATTVLKNLYERCGKEAKSRPSFSEITETLASLINKYDENTMKEAVRSARSCILRKREGASRNVQSSDYQQPVLKSRQFIEILENWSTVGRRRSSQTALSVGFTIAIAMFGVSFQHGYIIAVVNSPANEIKDLFFGSAIPCSGVTAPLNVSSGTNKLDQNCTIDNRDLWWALAISIFAIGGIVGNLLVQLFPGWVERPPAMFKIHSISIASALCFGLSKPSGWFALIVVGRFLVGVFTGLATVIVRIHVRKVSSKKWFTTICNIEWLLIAIGILVAQFLGLETVLGTDELWPWLLVVACIPSVLTCCQSFPENPEEGDNDAQNTDDVTTGIYALEAFDHAGAEKVPILELFCERTLRKQLIIFLLMTVAQQFSGITAIFSYTYTILDIAGIPKGNRQEIASVTIAVANVLMMSLIAVGALKRVKRKKLLIAGFTMMTVSSLVTAAAMIWFSSSGHEDLPYWSAAFIILYISGFSIGPGYVTRLITAQLFRPQQYSSVAAIDHLLTWTCISIVNMSFPFLANAAGPHTFLIFMVVCVLVALYLAIFLPETKGKTFQSIEDFFAARTPRNANRRVVASPRVRYQRNVSRTNSAISDGAERIKLVISSL